MLQDLTESNTLTSNFFNLQYRRYVKATSAISQRLQEISINHGSFMHT